MQLHELKEILQQHLSDGLVTIVGSGLSCAEGLPGMAELAGHLCNRIPEIIPAEEIPEWDEIAKLIDAEGLEAALLKRPPKRGMEAAIARTTTDLIAGRERKVIAEVFSGVRVLRLTRLIRQLLKPPSGLPIVTTNYDRLVELAAEEAGLGVDTMFFGRFAGVLNERESKLSFCRDASLKNKRVALQYRLRANVYKPHGSLDWYLRQGKPVQFSIELDDAPRLVITPGNNKFRNGYESPFDLHLGRANAAIDRATRFLILGYGFNDDHLETHLSPAIRAGKPTLLMTHTLTENARKLALGCGNVLALTSSTSGGVFGTEVFFNKSVHFFENLTIWDVDSFVSEVLVP